MRKRLTLSVFTLFMLIPFCFAQSAIEKPEKSKAEKPQTSKGDKSTKGTATTSPEEKITAKEKEVWEAFKRKDANALIGTTVPYFPESPGKDSV